MNTQSEFSLGHDVRDGIARVLLKGYLDAHTAPVFEKELATLVEEGNSKFVVNFADLEYISSAGLGVFMVFIEEVRGKGGDIKLSSMKPRVFSVFDLLGFPMLFDIVNTDEEALARFNTTHS